MEPSHSLLKRQLKRHFGQTIPPSQAWHKFLESIDKAYREFDTDRAMLERSLDLSSQELEQRVRARTEDLGRSLSLLQATFEATADGILVINTKGEILSFNQKFMDMWLIPDDGMAPRDLRKMLTHMVDQLRVPEVWLGKIGAPDCQRDTETFDVLEFKDGRVFDCYSQPQRMEGVSIGRVWNFRNITEQKRAEAALAEQAIRDVLTGLYNRRYLYHRAEEEIARARRRQHTVAFLLCDLDQFKTVNDTLGHHVGDEVLKAVAQVICAAVRGTDLVVRWGGDEMVVVISDEPREGILAVADRIRTGVQKLKKTIHTTARLSLDISIGVAIYPEHGFTVDELIRLADRSLYIAKKGGDKIHIGEEEYHLNDQSIKIVFQPIVDVRSRRVVGHEALSRDPRGKLNILEMFQRYQAIGQLNELKRICFLSQLKAAQAIGLDRLFINVDFDVIGQLDCPLKPHGMDVILEISELEALHDLKNHLDVTRRWRASGFKFAIDDFGAGFISLPFIDEAVPEYIKIDRSTILQAVGASTFRKFLKDLVTAIRNYATEGIIAEGVETEHELDVVKELGIDLVQGYLLGRPQELPIQAKRAA